MSKTTKRMVVIMAGLALICLVPRSAVAINLMNTKHNLSASGPGTVKADTETRICVFCHTPHAAIGQVDGLSVPLWNHDLSTESYQLYTSTTLLSPTNPAIQPDGDSRLCLSCHDGTIAIGSVVNLGGAASTISVLGTEAGGEMPVTSTANMGTNLSGHHPVSIEVNDSLINDKDIQCVDNIVSFRVCYPPVGQPVKLRPTNNQYGGAPHTGLGVQCTACHDPHTDPTPGITFFLRAGDMNTIDPLCSSCHVDCSSSCP